MEDVFHGQDAESTFNTDTHGSRSGAMASAQPSEVITVARDLNFVITKDAKPASTPYFPLKINPLGEFSPSLHGGGSKSWRTTEFMNLFKQCHL